MTNEKDVRGAQELRQRLPRAWGPFFGRFGTVTEVQRRGIPLVLNGRNVVICAPTASGKTEAVAAPVAELLAAGPSAGLGVVYVVPTRALGNDLVSRLEGPLEEMYLKCVLKHGDRPTLPTGEIHWLITTPESLDSLICRRSDLFSGLRTVILDEIHLIDGTYRGDQVRVLLKRLGDLASTPSLTVHMLSATLPDPAASARRYAEDFEIVTVGDSRNIDAYLLHNHEEVRSLAQTRHWRKLLYFYNSRKAVEEAAGELQAVWKPYPVVVHHGSLDRHQREEAEEIMKQNAVAVCVATSTLETGIDIGDVNLVVLGQPPWSLEALQQRIGRGSRRSTVVSAAALYQTEEERTILELMFEAAGNPSYRPDTYRPDLSVVVQQTLSLLYQFRSGINRASLLAIVGILSTPHANAAIARYLAERGYCLEIEDRLYPSSQLLDLGDEGRIHSNIPDHNDYRVVNADTGQPLGRIRGSFDQVFLLSGQCWQVVAARRDEVLVRRSSRRASPASFGLQRNVGQFHHLLPPELRGSVDVEDI